MCNRRLGTLQKCKKCYRDWDVLHTHTKTDEDLRRHRWRLHFKQEVLPMADAQTQKHTIQTRAKASRSNSAHPSPRFFQDNVFSCQQTMKSLRCSTSTCNDHTKKKNTNTPRTHLSRFHERCHMFSSWRPSRHVAVNVFTSSQGSEPAAVPSGLD